MRVVEQIKTMLDLASIDAEVVEEEEENAIPVPNKALAAMRRSDAGIICVNADESRRHEDGTYTINENVLIEIGAAFVLYDTRVILLWDKRLLVPSNLQGLYRCEFEGEEIGWDAGMKLMKAVARFRERERRHYALFVTGLCRGSDHATASFRRSQRRQFCSHNRRTLVVCL